MELLMMAMFIIMLCMLSTSNPVNLILLIIIQTMWTAMMTNWLKEHFWLGYILILIFLGGMLILFSYICSLASNEIFKFNNPIYMFTTAMLVLFINNSLMMQINNETSFINTTSLYLQDYKIMILLLAYLLIALLIVTKITLYKMGPLQQKT